jgi:putative oxidoreductase
MKMLALFSQLLLGLMFLVFGLDFFFPFIPTDLKPATTGDAKAFIDLLVEHKFMNVVMALEIAGGIALLTLRWTNLGVLIVGPILVNIVLYHLLIAKGGFEIPGLATVLMIVVVSKHWKEWQSALD